MKCLAHSTMPTPMPPSDQGQQHALGLGLAALPVHDGQRRWTASMATTKQAAERDARPACHGLAAGAGPGAVGAADVRLGERRVIVALGSGRWS